MIKTIAKKKMITLAVVVMTFATAALSAFLPLASSVTADSNPASWVMCMTEDGRMAYNAATTDSVYYALRSKSAITDIDGVDISAANMLLSVSGHDFIGVNEAILGRPLNPDSLGEEEPGEANATSNRVSPFDRFGLAGLRWSSYAGEWKYYHIDACSKNNDVSKTNFGSFYEHRKEPKATYGEVSTSQDPRSMQFNKGVMSSWGASFNDLVANALFGITKGVVALTITFIGFAFTDITTLIGLSADGTANNGVVSIFNSLFNNVFQSFVVLAFLVTACYLIYYGLIKRQFRQSLNILMKGLLAFFVAYLVAGAPSFWIGLPNTITTYGQSIVITAMGGSYDSKSSLCSTNVGLVGNKTADLMDESELEKVSNNMKSVMGCRLWEEMLFKPWVRGQFGTEYESLDADKLGNINSDWVGDASVPVGNGEYINNWALFHLSTQTNAHAALGEKSNIPVYVTGVPSDWWRIVDALSNYDEHQVTTHVDDSSVDVTFDEQVPSSPTPYWQSWIGNNSSERIGTAFISIVFGILGSIGPLVFSFMSAIFGLMLTLLMVLSPIFFMFGIAGDRGNRIFMGWLEVLVSTIIKRIATAGLLVLSFSISMASMNLIYTVGWVRAFLMLLVVTTVLVNNRNQLLDLVSQVDFGGIFNPARGFKQVIDKNKQRARRAGLIAIGGVSGAKAAADSGQSVLSGARIGAKAQVLNTMRQTTTGQKAYTQYQATVSAASRDSSSSRTCVVCGVPLYDKYSPGSSIVYSDELGNYYCRFCGEESAREDLFEIVITGDDLKQKPIHEMSEKEKLDKYGDRLIRATSNRSWLSYSKISKAIKPEYHSDGSFTIDNEATKGMILKNIKAMKEDMIVFDEHKKTYGRLSLPPAMPEALREYIDLALLNEGWSSGKYDYVENAYREGWKDWYKDNAANADNISDEEIKAFFDEIDNYIPELEDREVIIEKYSPTNKEEIISSYEDNKDASEYENDNLIEK